MGRPDTNEESKKVPVIHPMLITSNNFNKIISVSRVQLTDNYTSYDDIQRVSVRDLIGLVYNVRILLYTN